MKREQHLNGGDLPPFYENLIFWAPLTEGDLTDHISGVTGVVGKQDASITWDAAKQMYHIVSGTSYSGSGFKWPNLNLGLNFTSASTVEFTMHCKHMLDSNGRTNNYCRAFILGNAVSSSSYIRFIPYLVYNESRVPNYNVLYNTTVVVKNGTYYYYIDGGGGLNTYGPYSANINNNGRNKNELNQQVSIGLVWYTYYDPQIDWVKDMRLYNRALTASEVAQL